MVCNSIYIVADEKKRDIDWEGTWHEGERSIAPYPIRASYDDTYIYVDASSSHSEFFIQIYKYIDELVVNTTGPYMTTRVYDRSRYKDNIILIPNELVAPLNQYEIQKIMNGFVSRSIKDKIEKSFAIHYFL